MMRYALILLFGTSAISSGPVWSTPPPKTTVTRHQTQLRTEYSSCTTVLLWWMSVHPHYAFVSGDELSLALTLWGCFDDNSTAILTNKALIVPVRLSHMLLFGKAKTALHGPQNAETFLFFHISLSFSGLDRPRCKYRPSTLLIATIQ